jgi:predicted phosphodiesterase
MMSLGRSCPLAYRYAPESLMEPVALQVDTLWIAGGLYGNTFALRTLLDAFVAEPGEKALVFNGDFHWFDVDREEFLLVNDTVLGFHATRGNVETELAAPEEGAGCGCGYPEWVGEATVAHSNRIIERLRSTARKEPEALARLARLPMHLSAVVGDARIAIVHGDAHSLAGWDFSQESLATPEGSSAAQRALARAGADIFASSHTCLPVLQRFDHGIVVNNGAAGMPNFHGESYGIATRISVRRGSEAIYAATRGSVSVEAVPLRFDAAQWQERFLAQWPPGSDAHESYWERIVSGPSYRPEQALRIARSVPALPGR